MSQNPQCETCGENMRQFVWKKPKSVRTKSGAYRRISCLTKSYRCLDCPGALSDKSSGQQLLRDLGEGGGDVHVRQEGVVQKFSPESEFSNLEETCSQRSECGSETGQG